MNIFDDTLPLEKQHPIYRQIKEARYEPERAVLRDWANGFVDRDGKFCREFQTSFEPCLWELYLHAWLRHIGATIDFSFSSPDFVLGTPQELCIEATIAGPPVGGKPAYGFGPPDLPEDLNIFNAESTLRICNSFSSKVKKYRQSYSRLTHVRDKAFVIAIASFDRPGSHLSASRPIMSALYGLYHDEELSLSTHSSKVISYNVDGVNKSQNVDVQLGYFADDAYKEVSAVIFSSLATWGKVRALADNPTASTLYTTFHPNPDSIFPIVKKAWKADYREHLLDGAYVFHNPFATRPLHPATLAHPRVAQVFVDPNGEVRFEAPDDFLLVRFLMSCTGEAKDRK